MSTSTKIKLCKTYKTFFLIKTTRVSESSEVLNSSLAQLAGMLWLFAKYAQGCLLWDLKLT